MIVQSKRILRKVIPTRFHASVFFPAYLRDLVFHRTNMVIASGPFRGMKYINFSHGSVLVPKILGIYERELHTTLDEALTLRLARVVDIGAAEGYYAVGMACKLPNVEVIAFETDGKAQTLMSELAVANDVSDRLTIHGECISSDLRKVIRDGNDTLVICDVEGAEKYLLDPKELSSLRHCHIAVELHKRNTPDILQTIRDRFSSTHDITEIHQEMRSRQEFPYQTLLTRICPPTYVDNALSEFRQPWEPKMSWLWMRVKSALAA